MRIFLLFVCTMVYPLLHCMEDVMINHIAFNVDYREQRTIAILSKACNKMIEDNYRPCKKRIEQLMLEKKTPLIRGEVSWNKDFSRCAWVTIRSDFSSGRKLWGLALVGLCDKDTVIKQYQEYIGFYFPAIEGDIRPFFNKNGKACFHGYTDTVIQPMGYEKRCQSIVEFSIDHHGIPNTYRCFIALEENNDEDEKKEEEAYDFYYIFNFPVLLKAFLQSAYVRKYVRDLRDGWDTAKYYDISGVIIPEDYKTYKAHPFFKNNPRACYDELTGQYRYPFATYEEFPERLRNAIDERYALQQREKKMLEDMLEKVTKHYEG